MKALTKFVVLAGLFACTINTLPSYAATNALREAINHPNRSAVNKARDVHRHPYETLSFFDVKADSTVVEISPGGGWYTEILAPLLKEKGKYYAAHQPADATSDYAKRTRAAYLEKLASDPVYSAVTVTGFAPDKMYQVAPAGSADVVLTFRNLHNWYEKDKGEASLLTAFKTFHAALKPGGVLGVVEHRLPESKLNTDWTESGYMPQSMVIRVAEQAGFVLDGTSEVNANPKDTADHPKGVWTLPPVLALKEQDKAKYIAIGESDRMTLKFRKKAE
ncbi:class I SAM-dependent methyltransferase [Rheinheimera sp. 4Y26]|uniref:class I SAM-dependent methyltransferase n=1 Tax=Rheinheimera sp. 4Y26 TaxID=2977811 RepID=UPI0021B123DA|nr:methyltransferase [Rheinheimera sp. 4Y26]MCT6698521.1 methyltransferase [Rheinheimera sp. 4Y26]